MGLRELEFIQHYCVRGREEGRGGGGEERGRGREHNTSCHTLLCASTNLTPFQDIERMISGNFFMFSVDVWSTQIYLSKSPYTTSILHGLNSDSAYNSIQASVKLQFYFSQ